MQVECDRHHFGILRGFSQYNAKGRKIQLMLELLEKKKQLHKKSINIDMISVLNGSVRK